MLRKITSNPIIVRVRSGDSLLLERGKMKGFKIIGLILSILLPDTIMAEGNEELVYHYRTDVMEASSHHLKALKRYVEGHMVIKNHVPAHVDALLDLNGMYQELFPAGKQHPESEALPAIWSDPQGFQYAIRNNQRRIMALKQVDTNDMKAMKRAVNEVRMSCGDCHSYYRER